MCRFAHSIGARFVPVVDLQTDEHANDDDQEIERNRGPFLLAYMSDDAAQNHGTDIPLNGGAAARAVASLSVLAGRGNRRQVDSWPALATGASPPAVLRPRGPG
ncbi:MAG: hypothetical protein IPJ97_10560 [Proteobacteria bacterium]|nr:hypothetical protein [Pseudomonadota bacterium]